MATQRKTVKAVREAIKKQEEHRLALRQSIETKEDFQRALKAAYENLAEGELLSVPNDDDTKIILTRGNQILDPEVYWEVVEGVGIERKKALDLVATAIREGTAYAINKPYFEYLRDIFSRCDKLAREMKAGKYNQEIFWLRFDALYFEFAHVAEHWDKQAIDRPEHWPSTRDLFQGTFAALATWGETDEEPETAS
jgi:hypothetical protein